MSEKLNNGFELFLFYLVGKFSLTETKNLILTAILKAWLLSVTSLRPPIFHHAVFVLSIDL